MSYSAESNFVCLVCCVVFCRTASLESTCRSAGTGANVRLLSNICLEGGGVTVADL